MFTQSNSRQFESFSHELHGRELLNIFTLWNRRRREQGEGEQEGMRQEGGEQEGRRTGEQEVVKSADLFLVLDFYS